MDQLSNTGYCILSGYIRYRPINKTFYLMVNSRILARYLKLLNKKIRGAASRCNNYLFFLNFNEDGNIVTIREKEIVITISGNKLLNSIEISKLKNKDPRLSFPTKIIINPAQLSLDKYFFYPDKDAAKLAFELENLDINIPSRIMTSLSFDSDLEFNYKNKKVFIEITTRSLSTVYQANFKHQAVGGNIRAHIFDIYRKCVTDKILNKNDIMGFVVLSRDWQTIKHINTIIDECKLVNCHILFTSFLNQNWSKDIAKEIVAILENDARTDL